MRARVDRSVCGRYTLASVPPAELRGRFAISESVQIIPRYNVAPGDPVLAITTDRAGDPRAEMLRWGLVPPWSERPERVTRMINARVETASRLPAFRHAFERFRCLILADGFYEWRSSPRGAKQALHITRRDRAPFAFAGLWSIWRDSRGTQLRTCTILTTAANPAIAPLHNRMPVILQARDEEAWLRDPGGTRLDSILRGLGAAETELTPVGPAVNDARYDGPECLAPALEQPALF